MQRHFSLEYKYQYCPAFSKRICAPYYRVSCRCTPVCFHKVLDTVHFGRWNCLFTWTYKSIYNDHVFNGHCEKLQRGSMKDREGWLQ